MSVRLVGLNVLIELSDRIVFLGALGDKLGFTVSVFATFVGQDFG